MRERSPSRHSTSKGSLPRAGFTLIEVVSSLAIMTVLMLGLSSSLMISASAIPDANEYGQRDQEVHLALDEVRDDLRLATTINLVGLNGADQTMTLTMQSNGVLGESKTVKYSYDKSAGTFSRKADTEAQEVILSNIGSFSSSKVADGLNYRQINFIVEVNGTTQVLFERHVVLPNKPGSI